jgi:hypothetical protein
LLSKPLSPLRPENPTPASWAVNADVRPKTAAVRPATSFLEDIASKRGKKAKEALDWYGAPYDPEEIDEQQINITLGRIAMIVLKDTASNLVGDLYGYITAPAFSDIESDDANRIAVLARKQQVDHCLAVSSIFVGLAPGSPEPGTEVIQHDVCVLLRYIGS